MSSTPTAKDATPPSGSPQGPAYEADAADRAGWQAAVAPFRKSDTARSVFQLVSTFAAFFAAWALAVVTLDVSIWLTLTIDLFIAGVLVRLFIIQHDCGHGSFFATERANRIAGNLPGVFMLTPYTAWRQDHARHHATTGDLDKRGVGDITTWTVEEYRAASASKRFGYRLMRHPFTMLVGGPLGVFVLGHRVPAFFSGHPNRDQTVSVHLTTLIGLSLWAIAIAVFGWRAFLLIHAPAMWVAGGAGIFLFYAQHQFPQPYWRHTEDWNYLDACLEGSTYLKLNPLLAWFSGDIGVHHLHHLAPRIPNYRLRACLRANPQLQAHTTLSLWDAIKTLRLKLYDEDSGRMVGFSDVAIA